MKIAIPQSRLDRRRSLPALGALGLALALGAPSLGCEGAKAPADAPASEPASAAAPVKAQDITVVGENYCLGCGLKKAEGAAAQCSTYGHRHGIRVEAAKGEGDKSISALAGETLHYLDNDKSAALIKGEDLHNRKVELKGRLFPKEQVLEVREVKPL